MAFTPCASITSGLNGTSCTPNPGGVSEIYLCNFTALTFASSTGGTVSGLTGSTGATSTPAFYTYSFRRNTCNAQEDLTKDLATGSSFITQTITIVLDHKDKVKRDELSLLNNALVAVIAKHSDGTYWLYGHGLGTVGDGMYVTTNVSQTGTAKADANGYTVTMVAEESDYASPVSTSILAGLGIV